jgi:hypothetical protein
VKGILLDMARTWTRLALEAEQWNRENFPTQRLAKNTSSRDRVKIICSSTLSPHALRQGLGILELELVCRSADPPQAIASAIAFSSYGIDCAHRQ